MISRANGKTRIDALSRFMASSVVAQQCRAFSERNSHSFCGTSFEMIGLFTVRHRVLTFGRGSRGSRYVASTNSCLFWSLTECVYSSPTGSSVQSHSAVLPRLVRNKPLLKVEKHDRNNEKGSTFASHHQSGWRLFY